MVQEEKKHKCSPWQMILAFAPYISRDRSWKVIMPSRGDTGPRLGLHPDDLTGMLIYSEYQFKLILKPLSQLSDEDAIELIKMQFDVPDTFEIIKFERIYKGIPNVQYRWIPENPRLRNNDGYSYSEIALLGGAQLERGVLDPMKLSIRQYQYLLAKGYDLPSIHLDMEFLIEYDLCEYE